MAYDRFDHRLRRNRKWKELILILAAVHFGEGPMAVRRPWTVASLALNIVLACVMLFALFGRSASRQPSLQMMPRTVSGTSQIGCMGRPATAVNFHKRFKFQPNRKPNPPRKWPMKTGDKVKVISGADKGKEGEISRVYRKTGYVLVKDINMKTKHQKGRDEEVGAIIQIEAPIHHSNLKVTERSVYTKSAADPVETTSS
ncbi:hypothetical protein AAMO2058_000882200 [Amorphochlora amoebiformis]